MLSTAWTSACHGPHCWVCSHTPPPPASGYSVCLALAWGSSARDDSELWPGPPLDLAPSHPGQGGLVLLKGPTKMENSQIRRAPQVLYHHTKLKSVPGGQEVGVTHHLRGRHPSDAAGCSSS